MFSQFWTGQLLACLNSPQAFTYFPIKICITVKRVLVHEKIFDKFRDAMVKHTKTIKVGAGTDPEAFVGPIQNAMQYERVKGFFDDIETEKYNVAVGGKNPDGPGYFINPTIIDRPDEKSRIVMEEPFGMSFLIPILLEFSLMNVINRSNCTSS